MPVDKKVKERHLILDRLFRTPEGMSYLQIKQALEEEGINVSTRTLQQDIDVFESHYNARFQTGLRKGHSTLIRYRDITSSVLDKSDIAEQLLQVSEKINQENPLYPHFILASSIIKHIASGNDVACFYDAVDFGGNTELSGIEYFGDILKAIINKQCISFDYQPFDKQPIPLTVSPYLLKQYNQRWSLICRTKGSDRYSIDALDRIVSEIRPSDDRFVEPDDDILSSFDSVIGTNGAFDPFRAVETVQLRVKRRRYYYIETKPIHASQEKIDEDENTVTISLRVKVNPELISAILSFGDDVEVLSPETLGDSILQIINNISDRVRGITK